MLYGELRDQVRGLTLLSAKGAPMANSEIGTSTSNTVRGEYQVFLSCREPDTHRKFTKILHQALVDAGISVFIDDEGLQMGERIHGNLLQVIDNSKLYIPIFFKGYAASHLCLEMLARMVENTSTYKHGEKVILPIFYNVTPDDVKLKTNLYEDAILNLEQKTEDRKSKFSPEDKETWRKDLKEVGRIKGWEMAKFESHAKLIEAVAKEVVRKLKTRHRCVTEDLVGMENQIAAITDLLDIDSSDVRLIGIYGMGGIGKTTLTRIIFNKLLPHFGQSCSFLEDVREKENTDALVELQKRLLNDISRGAHFILNPDHGTKRIEDTICNKKVLIVLDDVDKTDHIQKLIGRKLLYPGTRILVTTRHKNVLTSRTFKYEFKKYEMMELNMKDALKLFSRHAFDEDSPPYDYYTLSWDIVCTTHGLPLALQAIGSSLFQKRRKIWEEWLDKLQKTAHEDVLAKLRMSYDALDWYEQEIFLDIACFLVGENKTNPMYVWKDCGFYPESTIDVLVQRCMVKELDDNSLWMHDQFRDLGRTIAEDRGTRLWDKDDIICKLRSRKIQDKVHAFYLKSRHVSGPYVTITSEQINRFPHIQFLFLCEVLCQGDLIGRLSELKWINLDNGYAIPPIPNAPRRQFEITNSLHLENAVVVNLSGVDITQDVFKSLIKGARKLKVLSLHYNTLICGTSTFPQNLVIEKLTISNFLSLMEIDCSIGKLTKLTDLSFELCVKLEKLPEQIGELQELQHLSLRRCDSLRELPNSVLKLESLTKLDVLGTRITRLPDSIGRLSSLSSVDVSFTSIEKLPRTMSKLLCLQTLHLNHCDQIQELPELPRNLTTLQLTSTSLVTVPNLSYLVDLVELALSNGSESMAKSDKIQTCDLQWMGSLSKLSKLQFCFSNVCVSTIELASLLLLEELTLHGVDVPAFKQIPPKLIVLQLYDTRGKQVRPPPLEKETAIVSSGSTESREIEVLRQIEMKFMEEHDSSKGSVRLREEPGCNELQAPELIDHWRGDFHFPRSLNMLRKFVLWGCPGVQDIQFVPTLLLRFSVGGCTSLKRLGGLSNLKYLAELTLNRCWSLQVVEGIDKLGFLHRLEIDRCPSVESILDPLSSIIPKRCSILIKRSGELPNSGRTSNTWESYKEKILNGTETETTDSETETGDAPQKKLRLASVHTVPDMNSKSESGDSESETEERVRLLSIHRSSLFLLLYLLSISALFCWRQ